MQKKEQLIQTFESYIPWLRQLQSVPEARLREPIAEGKWSPAEIVAHLLFWDRVMQRQFFPFIAEGARIESRDFAEYKSVNREASAYARSGIQVAAILDESARVRGELIAWLAGKSEEEFVMPFTINGHDESLQHLVEDFTGHDCHHRGQIDRFLQAADA